MSIRINMSKASHSVKNKSKILYLYIHFYMQVMSERIPIGYTNCSYTGGGNRKGLMTSTLFLFPSAT